MIPLFGDPQPAGKRDVLEGRLIWVALEALRLGTNVVLDFGFWGRDERSSLHWLAGSVGASCQVVYLPVDRATQVERIQHRWKQTSDQTFVMTQGGRGSMACPVRRAWQSWRAVRSGTRASDGPAGLIGLRNDGHRSR
jgi:predicted kinase